MPSHDVMPNMELYQPVQVEDALAIADRLAERGWLVGGGQDTYGWLKDRAKSADALIDLSAIESLRGIRETADGIEIGALTTLTEVCDKRPDPQLFAAGRRGQRRASPQIRNIGTLGGNVSQDVRCWYYRRGAVLLPGRRKPLLRGYTAGHEPRTRSVRSEPLRRGRSLRIPRRHWLPLTPLWWFRISTASG